MSQFTFMTINFLLFHTCWMANAYGASYEWYWLGPLFVVPSLIIHLTLIGSFYREALYILVSSIIGYSMNSVLFNLGLIDYSIAGYGGVLAPTWMFFLWMIFSSLFHGSLHWLKGRFYTQVVLGMILGPFAYLSARVLDALAITDPLFESLLIVSVVWGGIFRLLSWLAFEVEPFSEVDISRPLKERTSRLTES